MKKQSLQTFIFVPIS